MLLTSTVCEGGESRSINLTPQGWRVREPLFRGQVVSGPRVFVIVTSPSSIALTFLYKCSLSHKSSFPDVHMRLDHAKY